MSPMTKGLLIVAALLLLYRALVPAGAVGAGGAGAPSEAEPRATSPFIFE